MKIYAISGLGADRRVFDHLNIHGDIISLDWIQPKKQENLSSYALRLADKIESKEDFCLIGVSFGGLIAVEISKQLNPKLTFLISSAETINDLSPAFIKLGRTGINRLIPKAWHKPPKVLLHFLFGTNNKALLNAIIDDTDKGFIKWAINALVRWNNEDRMKNTISIHGDCDKLIPLKANRKAHIIKEGEHFMVVDRAVEVSKLINRELSKLN